MQVLFRRILSESFTPGAASMQCVVILYQLDDRVASMMMCRAPERDARAWPLPDRYRFPEHPGSPGIAKQPNLAYGFVAVRGVQIGACGCAECLCPVPMRKMPPNFIPSSSIVFDHDILGAHLDTGVIEWTMPKCPKG